MALDRDGRQPQRVKSQPTSVTIDPRGAMRGDETVEGRQAIFCNAKSWHGLG